MLKFLHKIDWRLTMLTYISKSEDDTKSFAKDFAKNLKTGDVIVLTGDLRMWKNKIYRRNPFLFWATKRNF